MANAIVTVQGGSLTLPTLLGQGPARIPTGGKIRPGIMVLTKKAAEIPGAKEIYQQGVADGHSFEQICAGNLHLADAGIDRYGGCGDRSGSALQR